MRKYLCGTGKVLLKVFAWILVCSLPTVLFVFLITHSFLFNLNTNPFFFNGLIGECILWGFQLNPIYLSIINYRFIRKKNAFFIWLFLVLLQTPWYFPLIFRENNEWLAIPILVSYIGHYQIIGITICFGIACIIKYIVHRHKQMLKASFVDEAGKNE